MSASLLPCKQCPRTFKLVSYHEKHKLVHKMKAPYICHICNCVYGAAKGLEDHIKTHEKDIKGETGVDNAQQQKNDLKRKEDRFPIRIFQPTTGLETNSQVQTTKPSNIPSKVTSPSQPLQKCEPSDTIAKMELLQSKLNPDKRGQGSVDVGIGSYIVHEVLPTLDNLVSRTESGFFKCPLCSRNFSGLKDLQTHIPIHGKKVQYCCDSCGFVFDKQDDLFNHLREHACEPSLVCEVCALNFVELECLRDHFKIHRNQDTDILMPFRCHLCPVKCNSAFLMRSHLAVTHPESFYRNSVDTKAMNNNLIYEDSKVVVVDQRIVSCPMCKNNFPDNANLRNHLFQVHGKESVENNLSSSELRAMLTPTLPGPMVSILKATLMKKPLNQKYPKLTYKQVMRRNSSSATTTKLQTGDKLFIKCCNMDFYKVTDFLIHSRLIHKKIVDLSPIGQIIGVQDDTEDELIDTSNPLVLIIKNIITSAEKKALLKGNFRDGCNFCEEIFNSSLELADHMINGHIRGCSVFCQFCKKAFFQEKAMLDHVHLMHARLDEEMKNRSIENEAPPLAKKLKLADNPTITTCNQQTIKVNGPSNAISQPVKDVTQPAINIPSTSIKPTSDITENIDKFLTNVDLVKFSRTKEQLKDEDQRKNDASLEMNENSQSGVRKNQESLNDELSGGMPNVSSNSGFYPPIMDYCLPITLAKIWKKKAELMGLAKAIDQIQLLKKIESMAHYNISLGESTPIPREPPRTRASKPRDLTKDRKSRFSSTFSNKENDGCIPTSNKRTRGKSLSPNMQIICSQDPAVAAYECKIQSNKWPLECIKCSESLTTMESFDSHMNGHWSGDKCCPVCNLLIFSSRFNFKQHLKIHTGLKPFLCQVCKKAFRQKVHLVKHSVVHSSS